VIPTVFADASVIIAGAGSRTGASRAVLYLAEMRMIQLIVSRQVLDEVERNVRGKLPVGLPVLTEWLIYIDIQVVDDPEPHEFEHWLAIIERKDAPILEAAVQRKVNYFLTLNTKDFTPQVAKASGLNILTSGIFIQQVRAILSENL
jgi:predicted nucleic acid-binding protein